MAPTVKLFAQLILPMLVFLPLNACALSGGPLRGKVLEEGTEKPIADAIVVARWKGHLASFAHGRTVCVHVESTVTDENGIYRLPAWRKPSDIGWVRDLYPAVTAHKAGYQRSRASKEGDIEYLEPFTGGRGERLEYLRRVSSAVGCPSAGASERNLLPIRRALLDDARELAGRQYDKKIIEPFLFQVEMIELGYEVAERRQVERLRGKE